MPTRGLLVAMTALWVRVIAWRGAPGRAVVLVMARLITMVVRGAIWGMASLPVTSFPWAQAQKAAAYMMHACNDVVVRALWLKAA